MVKRTVSGSAHRLPIACALGLLVAGSSLGMAHRSSIQRPAVAENTTPAVRQSHDSVPSRDNGEFYVDVDLAYLHLSRSIVRHEDKPKHLVVEDYAVKDGDTLWTISNHNGTDIDTLLAFNPDVQADNLAPGTKIRLVPGFMGVSHVVVQGETVKQLAADYEVSVNEILVTNGLDKNAVLTPDEELLIPGNRHRVMIASRGDAPKRSEVPEAPSSTTANPPADKQAWIWPVTGGLYFSEFGPREGEFHSGLDIAVPTGTPAVAVQSGVVTFAGWDAGFGNSVMIDHGAGIRTRYAHASAILVKVGQSIRQGEKVILVGSTGHATGPHLHLEFLANGTAVNPRNFLP